MRIKQSGLALLGLSVLLAAGCQEEAITSYQVPREDRSQPPPPGVREPQRLLGAIVGHGDKTWFFKLLGAEPAVSKHEKEFTGFVESLQFTDNAKEPVQWKKVPQEWREMAGGPTKAGGPPRYRTFLVGPKESSLELIVTALEGAGGSMIDNVNRWRGQMGLGKIGEGELKKLTRETKVDGKTLTVVDMKSAGQLPPDRAGPPPVPGGPSYSLPKGWEKSTRRVPFSIATFQVREGKLQAEVTISPLQGAAGGLLSNVNRWRGQLGLEPVTERDAEKDLQRLEVAGVAGKYADLSSPADAGPARRRMLVVMVPREDGTWFFKMTGSAELVEKQKANFEAFLKSVRFGEGSGGKP